MAQGELFAPRTDLIGDAEQDLKARGIRTLIGVDEAGRGPLAGPVHAAAFWLDLTDPFPACFEGLDDSKKIKEARREELFEEIRILTNPQAIGISSAAVIDEINVLQATFRAMQNAVEEVVALAGATPDLVLIDGNMLVPGLELRQESLVKGDGRSYAIAAASILAKVSRDRFMRDADKKWPQYSFHSNKGYGSKAHRIALQTHGPTPIHRRSFAGVVVEG